jgi:hypothetical protein
MWCGCGVDGQHFGEKSTLAINLTIDLTINFDHQFTINFDHQPGSARAARRSRRPAS